MSLLIDVLGEQPEALLFDLDGTLVDSVPDIAIAINAMLAEHGFPGVDERQVRQWVGNGALKLVERALAYRQGLTEQAVARQQLAECHQRFLCCYQQSNGNHSQLYPGVLESLRYWRQKQLSMAVVTNKPIQFVPHLLQCLGISEFFAICLGGDSVPNKKPDPAMLYQACERLERSPTRSIVIGDSRNDIEAARAAHMPVVAVSYGYNYGRSVALEKPDLLIDDLRELLG